MRANMAALDDGPKRSRKERTKTMPETREPADKSLKSYERLLMERRSAVLAALGAKATQLARLDRVSDEDQAQHSHEEFVSLRLNGIEYRQLKQVEEALARLRSGEFGICLSCERPIPSKRLEAVPWTRFCVRCQERIADRPYRDSIEFKMPDSEDEEVYQQY